MQTLNMENIAPCATEFLGRKNRKSIRRKNKIVNTLISFKKFFFGVGSIYIILALVAYILFFQMKINNAIVSMHKDSQIPGYVIEKIVDYLN